MATPRPQLIALLPGEGIPEPGDSNTPKTSDEELNRRYSKGEVRIVTESARYPLSGILAMLREDVTGDNGVTEKRYLLDPEYQRRHRWSAVRKSRLIESFLMNVPVPPVFLYERELARFEVMDGRQRLNALSEFFDNKLRLEGLEHWPQLDGRTYATLPSKVKDGIERRYISSIILLQETASDPQQAAFLKKIVFERLNSGGVRLSPQESRNAVYNGPLNQLCMELSRNETFRSIWGIPGETNTEDLTDDGDEESPTNLGRRMFEKMEDVELVLRFFAYRQIDKFPAGLNKISVLLDEYLIAGNRFPSATMSALKDLFESTISLVAELLGPQPFCRLDATGEPFGRQTKIVFDPLMYIASKYSHGESRQRIISSRTRLKTSLGQMYETQEKLFSGRSTNSGDTHDRNRQMATAFESAISDGSEGR